MTMNYAKPEVGVLGEAVGVINLTHVKNRLANFEAIMRAFDPAYDLDE
jgi:hypothetical protein